MDHLQVLIRERYQWQTCTCTNFNQRWQQWTDCREPLNGMLESSRRNVSARKVQFVINEVIYQVDLWGMHQTNMDSGTVRAVRRVFICETDFLATEMVLEDQCLQDGQGEMMTDANDIDEEGEDPRPGDADLQTVEEAALIVEVLD